MIFLRNHFRIFILLIALISIHPSVLFASVPIDEDENVNTVNIESSPTLPKSTNQDKEFDSFQLSMILISLGCMMTFSSLHRSYEYRKELVSEINKLDTFFANTCAVEFSMQDGSDIDPMMNSISDIEQRRNVKIDALEKEKNVALKEIADVEMQIRNIW